jgi:hypothetical protein
MHWHFQHAHAFTNTCTDGNTNTAVNCANSGADYSPNSGADDACADTSNINSNGIRARAASDTVADEQANICSININTNVKTHCCASACTYTYTYWCANASTYIWTHWYAYNAGPDVCPNDSTHICTNVNPNGNSDYIGTHIRIYQR